MKISKSKTKIISLKSLVFSLLSILSLSLFFSCEKGTELPPKEESKEFTWSDEPIPGGEGLVPKGIWGSSPNDLWVTGWNSHQGVILHYDGKDWKDVTPVMPFNDEYHDVFGFGPDNVYVIGYKWTIYGEKMHLSALVFHYNGTSWKLEVDDPTNDGTFFSIHGNNPNNVWAAGKYGTIYHYDGSSWQRKNYPDSLRLNSVFAVDNDRTLFISEYYNYPLTEGWKMLYFSEYTSNGWQHLDSCKLEKDRWGDFAGYKFGHKDIWSDTDNTKLYTSGYGVSSYNEGNWLAEVWDDYLYNDIKGTSRDNIFVVGNHGTIRYYNGEKWNSIRQYSSTIVDFYAVMVFEDSVYILGYYENDTHLIKGVLKE